MNGQCHMRILVFFLVLVFSLSAGNAHMSEMNLERRSAAAALFERFETVFYGEMGLVFRSGSYDQLSEDDSNFLRVPFALLLSGLDTLGEATAAEMLASGAAVLVGARDFRTPKGLGAVHSQFCYVVVLRSGSAFDLSKYFSQWPSTSERGMPVWKWSANLGEFGEGDPRPSTLYASQIGQSYLLFSNNLSELRAMGERLSSGKQDARILDGIRDWGLVSQHKLWGYRRYRHAGIVNRDASGMTGVTRGAEALMYFFDEEKKSSVLRLLSSPKDEGTAFNISSNIYMPRMKPVGAGAWETVFPLAGDEDTFERLAFVMGLFGFGVYA